MSHQLCKFVESIPSSQSKHPLASTLPRYAVIIGTGEGHGPLFVLVLVLCRGRCIAASGRRPRARAMVLGVAVERIVLLEWIARVAAHSAAASAGIGLRNTAWGAVRIRVVRVRGTGRVVIVVIRVDGRVGLLVVWRKREGGLVRVDVLVLQLQLVVPGQPVIPLPVLDRVDADEGSDAKEEAASGLAIQLSAYRHLKHTRQKHPWQLWLCSSHRRSRTARPNYTPPA